MLYMLFSYTCLVQLTLVSSMYQISQSKEGIKRGRVRPMELNTENLGDPFWGEENIPLGI